MKRSLDPKGFTLVEMVVSMVIISFLSSVIYMTFFQGTRLWRYAMRERPEWQMDIFLDKLSVQLRNAFACKSPPFQGTGDSLEFCTLGPRGDAGKQGKPAERLPVGLRYFFDASKRTLFMTSESYGQVLNPPRVKATPAPVLERIDGVRLEYYLQDGQSWKRKWSRSCLPRAVKISIDYGDIRKKQITRFLPLMALENCIE